MTRVERFAVIGCGRIRERRARTVAEAFPLDRDTLMAELKERGVDTRRFFVPIHEQPVFEREGRFENERYPVAEDVAERVLYLPSTSHLSEEEIAEVYDAIETASR